jgi:mRNA interferase MazF
MTTRGRPYPTRITYRFQRKQGHVVLDQIRTVDKTRLVRRLGRLESRAQASVLKGLAELFAP